MEKPIEIKNLSKRYKGGVLALDNVSLTLEPGEVFGLLGPNGAGKTTMINCITSLAYITKGSISVMGYDTIDDYREAKNSVGLSSQDLKFDLYFSVIDLLVYQAGFFGIPKKQAMKRIEELLKRFDLYEVRKKTVRELSGGMKRKLSLVKALVHDPKILILDEPTAALDVDSRLDLWRYVRALNKDGITVLITTHYINEAEELADRICILNKGRIVKLDRKKEIMDTLTENVIAFSLDGPLKKTGMLKGFTWRTKNNSLEIVTPRKDQDKVLRKVIGLLDKHKIKYHNFEIHEDSLQNIFLRIIKNGK